MGGADDVSAEDQAATLEVGILGPLVVTARGAEVAVPTRRQRALLALLALNVGRVVSTERLIDNLWDGDPPPQAPVTLRSYVSSLRTALGGRDAGGVVLVTRAQGYALDIPPDAVDAVRLQRLSEAGHEHLRQGRSAEALAAFEAAVSLWRGQVLSEIADHEAAASSVTRLTELYLNATEGRFEAMISTGRHVDAIPGLDAFAAENPLREKPRALQMLALYRAGRAPEALEVHRRFRSLLHEELGIDPSPRLDQLNQQILEQDPRLDPPVAAPAGATTEPAAATPPPTDGAGPRLHGRDRESARIVRKIAAAQRLGVGGLVLVSGEPGIGKTAMLEHGAALALASGLSSHSARASGAAGAPAFWPWTQVLDSIAEGMEDADLERASSGNARLVVQLSPTIASRTGRPAIELSEQAPALKFALYDALATFLAKAAEITPLAITIDDLHLADLSSLEMLSYLTPDLATKPILLIAAYRDLPADRTLTLEATLATVSKEDAVDEIRLGGLDRPSVIALAEDLAAEVSPKAALDPTLDPAPDPAWVEVLHERTGGNPFFVRQLGRLLLEAYDGDGGPAGVHDETGARAAVGLPPGIRHVIASRLAHLSETTLALLEAASLLGREFDAAVLAQVLDLPVARVLEACDEASDHGLLEETPERPQSYRFGHALVQEVVARSLTPSRTARLHAALAEALEHTAAPVEEVAEHFWLAKGLLGDRALPHLLAAADNALAVVAYELAERQLRRAIDLVRSASPHDPQAELTILLRLFQLIANDRGWGDDDARAVVERARDLADLGALHGETVRLWWSLWLFLLGRDDSRSLDDVALALARALGPTPSSPGADDHDLAARAASEVMLAFTDLHHDRVDSALRRLDLAQQVAELAPNAELAAFDEHLHVMILLIHANVAALRQDREGHRRAAEAAIALADADGRAFPRAVARSLTAFSTPFVDDPTYALEVAEQALDIDRRYGFSWLATIASAVHAWANAKLEGADEAAVATLTDTLAAVTQGRSTGNIAIVSYLLADVEQARGRLDAARDLLARSASAPGPYARLMTERVEARLAQIAPEA